MHKMERENRQFTARRRAVMAMVRSAARTRRGIFLNGDGIPVHRDGSLVELPAHLLGAVRRLHLRNGGAALSVAAA